MVDGETVSGCLEDCRCHALCVWVNPVEQCTVTSCCTDRKIKVGEQGWVRAIRVCRVVKHSDVESQIVCALKCLIGVVRDDPVVSVVYNRLNSCVSDLSERRVTLFNNGVNSSTARVCSIGRFGTINSLSEVLICGFTESYGHGSQGDGSNCGSLARILDVNIKSDTWCP